jgi:hypothetical protein
MLAGDALLSAHRDLRMSAAVALAGPRNVLRRSRAPPAAIVIVGSSASMQEGDIEPGGHGAEACEGEDLKDAVAVDDVGFLVRIDRLNLIFSISAYIYMVICAVDRTPNSIDTKTTIEGRVLTWIESSPATACILKYSLVDWGFDNGDCQSRSYVLDGLRHSRRPVHELEAPSERFLAHDFVSLTSLPSACFLVDISWTR